MLLRIAAVLAFTALATTAAHAEVPPSPYAGQQARSIKALSDADLTALLTGQGAGMAKAAELNGYPGPAHVLELARELQLDPGQLAATRDLLAAHKERARALGTELIEAERDLDQLFAGRHADASAIDVATQRVGMLQAQLRAEHLKTHLSQTRLLSAEQVRHYAALRGYETSAPPVPNETHPSHHH